MNDSAQPQAAGVDDVFTRLNDELVGLLPVKKKVEEVASLLLVDRVRQRFGLHRFGGSRRGDGWWFGRGRLGKR